MRNNPWEELYIERGWGDWMTPRQGLTAGMDMLDWMRFILCAVHEIGKDPDPFRRFTKLSRLRNKAAKVKADCWMCQKHLAYIEQAMQTASAAMGGQV